MLEARSAKLDSLSEPWDVAVVGAGVNGATAYHYLGKAGYRVVLLDKSDFAGGTSQASAMMVWGGLLYLAKADIGTVRDFCRARDKMIDEMPASVAVSPNRYVLTTEGRGGGKLALALWAYWLLGGRRRRPPKTETDYPERALFNEERLVRSYKYEEACVLPSDARFVVDWVLSCQGPHQLALNHCGVEGGAWDAATKLWTLEVKDALTGREERLRARAVINAAGVWTDQLNARFQIETPYKHVYSKGVFIGLERDPRHELPCSFENAKDGDVMTLIPWGPSSLWGPTETVAEELDKGFKPEPEDVRFLLGEANRHLKRPVQVEDILSLRCGVRPLAVARDYQPKRNTLDISRRVLMAQDRERPWLSLYGGKLTGCVAVAEKVTALMRGVVPPTGAPPAASAAAERPTEAYPGLKDPVLSARHAAERELCFTLEDYLRRRTNVSQWVRRGGLGQGDEHLPRVAALAAVFEGASGIPAAAALAAYRAKIASHFDEVLAGV